MNSKNYIAILLINRYNKDYPHCICWLLWSEECIDEIVKHLKQ